MAEPVEQLQLLLAIPPERVVLGQVLHEFLDPRAQLVREVRRRRPDECVNGLPGRLRHREKPNR